MAIETNLLERTVADVLREALDDSGELYVVNPDAGIVAELVDVMDVETGCVVRVLAREAILKEATEEFKLAARAADHLASERLFLRTTEDVDNTLLVTEDSVVAVVAAGGRVAGLATDDEQFIERAYEEYTDAWAAGEPFALRTPPLSEIRETLGDALGAEAVEDFDAMLASLDAVHGEDGLDEVTISLLVAARNEELLYDVSKWGEDVGIASKATFSRTKTSLEEQGLIETETVPIDVGRPRLRLLLGDDRLEAADADEFATVVADLLAED
jgi:hypothetical protein